MLSKEKDILSMRKQYETRDRFLEHRLKEVMPALLKEQGVDLWVVLCGEYFEDPVFRSLTPSLMQHASRTSCLMFSNKDGVYRPLSLCRPNPMLSPYYIQGYDPMQEDQWSAIRRVISEHKGGNIAVNVSADRALSGGLSKGLFDRMTEGLDVSLSENNEMAVRWLETRTDEELAIYPSVYKIAMDIQKEAYSRDVITPGVTTTTDVEFYILQRINDMGLPAWFSPDVDVQRCGKEGRLFGEVIQEGDLIHTDMGIEYLGLNTDTQRLGYILRKGETKAPSGIMEGFRTGNRFQDIVINEMIEGRSGNEIFLASIAQAKDEGIRPMLYTHPIGTHGHGAGPLIGLYDQQREVVGGERLLYDSTCYALELNVRESVPEWNGQDVDFYIEETVVFKDGQTSFLDSEGRETMILI